MKVRYNVMNITSLMAFANIRGGVNQLCKDVYFIRGIGSCGQYLNDIEAVDKLLTIRAAGRQGRYIRLQNLPRLAEQQDIQYYTHSYDDWNCGGHKAVALRYPAETSGFSQLLNDVLAEALVNVRALFRRHTPGVSESMEKNFISKMLFWLEQCAGPFLNEWNENESCKLIYSGNLKKQEYLFLYFLTLLGIDVLMLSPAGELALPKELLALSAELHIGEPSDISIPPYDGQKYLTQQAEVRQAGKSPGGASPTGTSPTGASPTGSQPPGKSPAAAGPAERQKVNIRRADRDQKQAPPASSATAARTQPQTSPHTQGDAQELGFESLARMASSVVLIQVYDNKGESLGGGSGIMIGREGYILTNNHVIRGGSSFIVRIEDDPAEYRTDEVIKYHSVLDLALIRIDRQLNPITIYSGSRELVRGQKVVAIGSPLGLFNSVSDGIISGFREINHVQMIQFTAPISHGSSGGAVLNMMGEVIGISTAGFDQGQNINLAVSYQDINMFAQSFIR